MIFGIGTDVVRIERIAAAYERFGAHFVERLLLPQERAVFNPDRRAVRFLAMRFAADRKSTRLNSSHIQKSRMPSSA